MTRDDAQAGIASWLKDKGYSDEEVRIILSKLAEHDHETLSDAVFDSIGAENKSLEQMISDMLRE